VHVEEVTQPQGHSTSGSHERYKSPERLQWESDFDPIKKFRETILSAKWASEIELEKIETEAKKIIKDSKKEGWSEYLAPIKEEVKIIAAMLEQLSSESINGAFISKLSSKLTSSADPARKDIISAVKKSLRLVRSENLASKNQLIDWLTAANIANHDRYSSSLYSETERSALNENGTPPIYNEERLVDGREVLRENFDALLKKHKEILIFGEDAGKIGGVNQSLEGLQEKYGDLRVFDTGIRECTIIGQGIGMALRGLRPIAEIQYLDYLLYALQVMSDDLATVNYRTKGQQKAPLIVRTRGHRLEGIWHSGSPMGMILGALRGIYICVPRNMTQAAGFYNTLMDRDDPALVIESLNGYRLKEKLPSNLGEFKIPLGIPEIMKNGDDVTLVCYGSMVRMVEQAAQQLTELGISAEVIDVQTLLPFDVNHVIGESVSKTNRVVFIDEDVSGGATAYMMQKVIEEQGGYFSLDSEPKTLTAKDHRPAYGSDGDYFSKPSIEDIVDSVYDLFNELDSAKFPRIY